MMDSKRKNHLQSLILFLNVFILIILSILAFNWNPGRLYTGLDGPTLIAVQEQQINFFGISPHLHSSILEGLGNTYINNLTLFPRAFNSLLGTYSPVFSFTVFAVLLFISVLLVGWNYGFNRRLSVIAAWLLTILFLPYFKDFRIYNITETAPNIIQQIFIFVLMDIAIHRMGRINWFYTILYGIILLFTITFGFMLCPVIFLLIVPILFMTTIHAFITSRNPEENLRKLIMGLIVLIIVISAGWFHYLLGLILNTAAHVFSADIKEGYNNLIYVSILFQGQLPASSWGPWLFYSAVIGMLLASYQSSSLRAIAIITLLAQLMILGIGAIAMTLSKTGIGPPPIYWEVLLFPFYSLFAIYFYAQIFSKLTYFKNYPSRFDVLFPGCLAFILVVILLSHQKQINRGSSYALPPVSTAITDLLHKEIGIHINTVFSGRVINILPETEWFKQCAYFMKLDQLTGNDHQSSGLWLKNIPTLHEYNQGITPSFYRIYRQFLADPAEPVNRNWSSFSKVNLKILKLLGIRFIITPLSEIKGTKIRTQLSLPSNLAPLFLHEVFDTNISGISAQQILTVENISEAEKIMSGSHFKLEDMIVFAHEKLKESRFLPATKKKLIIEKGGFHLQAESSGTTLLLLPIEFSHCLHMKRLSGPRPKLMRVDIALTGVLFHRQVDILLDNRTGPFSKPRCKLEDYQEFKRLLA